MFVITALVILPACVTDGNSDEDSDFTVVPFEMFVSVNQMSDGTYNVSNGGFHATFKPINNAGSYEFRVIQEDKSKGDPIVRRVNQLQQIGDDLLRYTIIIGSSTFYMGLSESQKNEKVEEIQEILNERKHLYKELIIRAL